MRGFMRRNSRSWRYSLVGALALVGACASQSERAAPVAPAVAERGRAYAESNCARCHAVTPGERLSPNPAATPFQEIAETPGVTARALRAWLRTSHPTMPDLLVESRDIDDLWAYMEALRRKEPAG